MEMFLLDVAAKSTVVLAAAFGATWGMRRSSAAARHWVWMLVFAAVLVLPAFTAMLPAWRVLPSWSSTPDAGVAEAVPVASPSPQLPPLQAARTTVGAITETPSPAASERFTTVPVSAAPASGFTFRAPSIFGIYALGIAIFLLPLFAGMLALVRLERKSTRLNQAPWPALLASLLARLGVRRDIAIFESPSILTMPMTWGVWGSRILLPSAAQNWSAERRRLVLLHELAHAKRRDAATQFLARLACAIYWFHPLAWLALRQLRMEAEIACDDLVLAVDTKPSIYAEELLDIVSAHRGLSFLSPAVAMARGNHPQIHARIRAILDHTRNRRAMPVGMIVCMTAAAMLFLLPIALLRAQEAQETFSHVAHFDLGNSQFLPGDSITITKIRGTADTVTPGNTYQIKGTYTLASADDAKLATYVTGPANDTHHDPYDQRQTVAIKKGSGTFTVVLPFISQGWPHLSFYPAHGGSSFSTLYFGSAESLLKTPSPVNIIDRVGPAKASGPSVLILVSPGGIAFEGKATTWEALPALLEKVPNREGTILAFALTSDQMTVAQYHEAFAHVAELGRRFQFRYVSDTGIKALPGASVTTQPAAGAVSLVDPSGKQVLVAHNGRVEVQFQDGKIVLEADKIIQEGNSFAAQGNGVVLTKPGAKFELPTTMPNASSSAQGVFSVPHGQVQMQMDGVTFLEPNKVARGVGTPASAEGVAMVPDLKTIDVMKLSTPAVHLPPATGPHAANGPVILDTAAVTTFSIHEGKVRLQNAEVDVEGASITADFPKAVGPGNKDVWHAEIDKGLLRIQKESDQSVVRCTEIEITPHVRVDLREPALIYPDVKAPHILADAGDQK